MGGLAQAAVFRLMPNCVKRITLLLFPSRVLTRSGSADPELTVSAWRNVREEHHALGTPTRSPNI
jgi:hypothetical protein